MCRSIENDYHRLLLGTITEGSPVGHLLLVESWVGAMSALLPRAIRQAGHRFSFITRDLHHYLRSPPTAGPHPLLAADNVFTADTNDATSLAAEVALLHEHFGFTGVLTSCDYYLPAVAETNRRLGLTGATPEAVCNARSKDRMRRVLHETGVPGPAFALAERTAGLTEAAAAMGYPLVLKPVDLCAGMYVRKVDSAEQIREAHAELSGFPVNARGQRRSPTVLLEELLTGPEVSVETVTVDGHTTVVGVTDKSVLGEPCFIETGHMFPAALDDATETEVRRVAVAALEALELDNTVAHTEVKITPNGPRLVEVNPRPAGNQITELIRRVTGIDLPEVHARIALGEQPALERTDTGVGSAAVSFLLPPRAGVVAEIGGLPEVERTADVVECEMNGIGRRAAFATSNNQYLGRIMLTSEHPGQAREHADSLIASLEVRYADELASSGSRAPA